MRVTGRASFTNCCSSNTDSLIIDTISLVGNLFTINVLYSKHAKSLCDPSSLLINSFEVHNADINPLFFNQNIEQKLLEKNIPSTIANAIILLTKSSPLIYLLHHFALLAITGTVSIALNNFVLSSGSVINVSKCLRYVIVCSS